MASQDSVISRSVLHNICSHFRIIPMPPFVTKKHTTIVKVNKIRKRAVVPQKNYTIGNAILYAFYELGHVAIFKILPVP